jgi:4-amino-4-deoxy-L-arabinose transferase-like glycosyltransferase
MIAPSRLDRWLHGWRGPLMAALVAMIAGLPGVFAAPPLDRDESRFAQATAQMLETRDFTVIRFQDQPRFKKPVGIHWMQALSVSLLTDDEKREIWAWRMPSLLGAMLAAASCTWGAAAFFRRRTALLAGAILGASFLLSTEAFIAKTDAVLCGLTTLALAALARIYAESRGGRRTGRRTRAALWLGIALSILVKGPVGVMVAGLTMAALWIWDRKAPWLRNLGWGWGGLLVLAVVGPWAWAITVATDGGFWSTAIAGDLAPKLAGGQESHGAPPGYHLMLSWLLLFPAAMLLPAAVAHGWRHRAEPGVRFALCWLIPAWLVFEITPTKLAHYTLPTHGAAAVLMAASLEHALGRVPRWTGAALQVLAAALLAGGGVYLAATYGGAASMALAVLCAALFLAAGLVGAALLVRGRSMRGATAAIVLGVAAHGLFFAGLAPSLKTLWVSKRVAAALKGSGLDPRGGVAPGPVEIAGYAEPSLVFALGAATGLGDGPDAAQAVAEGRPAVVEAKEEAQFQQTMGRIGLAPRPVAVVEGFNYSVGKPVRLTVYEGEPEPSRKDAP